MLNPELNIKKDFKEKVESNLKKNIWLLKK